MVSKKAFIFHGAYGHPEENWFGWLSQKLQKERWEVFTPRFPTPQNQTLDTWFEAFRPFDHNMRSDARIIAHSLGATFALRLLEKIDFKIDSAFLVAGFTEPLGIRKFDPLNVTFLEKPFDWAKIRKNCGKFYVYGSDDDPIVKFELVEKLAKNLGTKMVFIPGAGHFNSAAGYDTFERLFIDVKNS